ncbi:MAG: ABC transporter ATP-binding protein, partial [Anaerolineales bacterium]
EEIGLTAMPEDVVISTQGLVKRFKGRRGMVSAVDGISLEVKRGETFGLIGPDGAGKSTTTRVILGLLRRDAGQSSVLGYDSMRDVYSIRENSGYIAQQFTLPADMTVIENLRFFADLHGIPTNQQKQSIVELLKFSGLTEFTSRPAGRLSGGMKKKLALACSLIHEPQVVLLDEPTLGVDPVSRREFWNLLGNLRAEKGLTIFVCTPYMDEAERCNQVGLIYKGRLIANNTPAGIKKMVPGQLLEFKPSKFVPARDLVTGLPGVLEVQIYGALLHIFVEKSERDRRTIEKALSAQGIEWSGMRTIEPRMEEAFISLVSRQEAEDHGQ